VVTGLSSVLTSGAVVGLSVGFSVGVAVAVVVGRGVFSATGVDGVQALTANKTKPAAREIYFFMCD
jgi:hypothetical protein